MKRTQGGRDTGNTGWMWRYCHHNDATAAKKSTLCPKQSTYRLCGAMFLLTPSLELCNSRQSEKKFFSFWNYLFSLNAKDMSVYLTWKVSILGPVQKSKMRRWIRGSVSSFAWVPVVGKQDRRWGVGGMGVGNLPSKEHMVRLAEGIPWAFSAKKRKRDEVQVLAMRCSMTVDMYRSEFLNTSPHWHLGLVNSLLWRLFYAFAGC